MKDKKEFIITIGVASESCFEGFIKLSCVPKPNSLVSEGFVSLISILDDDTIEHSGLDLRAYYDGHRVPAFLMEDKTTTFDKFLECAIITEELIDSITGRSKTQKKNEKHISGNHSLHR